MSITDQALLGEVQFAVVEPSDGGQIWPSGLWTREEVCALLTERQDQLLKQTLLLVTVSSPIAVGIGDRRLDLPADWIRTLAVIWTGNDGTIKELFRSDSFEADRALPTWQTTNATSPLVYMEFDAEALQIQIGPAPSVAGNLVLLYVAKGSPLTGSGVNLTVPDDVAHVCKYGLLAEMLSKEGRGKDPARAAYCEQRFDLGVEAVRLILKGWA